MISPTPDSEMDNLEMAYIDLYISRRGMTFARGHAEPVPEDVFDEYARSMRMIIDEIESDSGEVISDEMDTEALRFISGSCSTDPEPQTLLEWDRELRQTMIEMGYLPTAKELKEESS